MWLSNSSIFGIVDWTRIGQAMLQYSAADSKFYTWGTAHAAMATFSLKRSCVHTTYDVCGYYNVDDVPHISAHSIIYENLIISDPMFTCYPASDSEGREYTQYALELIDTFNDRTDWPVDNGYGEYCNMTLYTATHQSSFNEYKSSGVKEFPQGPDFLANQTYEQIVNNIKMFGFHYTNVLHDYKASNTDLTYVEVYVPEQGPLNWAPVLIFGVWEDDQGQIYLGGIFFGRPNVTSQKLMWFPIDLTSYQPAIHYLEWVYPVELVI